MKRVITALIMLSIIGCSKSDLKPNLAAANVQFISYNGNDLSAYVSAKSSTQSATVNYSIRVNFNDGKTLILPTDGTINVSNYFATKVYKIGLTNDCKNILSVELINVSSTAKIVNWNEL